MKSIIVTLLSLSISSWPHTLFELLTEELVYADEDVVTDVEEEVIAEEDITTDVEEELLTNEMEDDEEVGVPQLLNLKENNPGSDTPVKLQYSYEALLLLQKLPGVVGIPPVHLVMVPSRQFIALFVRTSEE